MRKGAVKAGKALTAGKWFCFFPAFPAWSAWSALSVLTASPADAQVTPRHSAFSPTTEETLYPLRKLGDGVYAVLGDTGEGAGDAPTLDLW